MQFTTAEKISRMKQQSFGVEIECNHISREKAARVSARYFGTNRVEDSASRNSYSCWSAWDQENREWRFQKDSSIAGPDEEKCEVITPILRYDDLPLLQELARLLRKAGARSSPSRGCGVHVHVGIRSPAGNHDARTLRNLTNLMASHEAQIARAIRMDQNRQDQYCKVVSPEFVREVNLRKPKTMEELSNIWYRTNEAMYNRDARYNSSRYHMLNLHAVFTKGTIEFRMFQFDEPTNHRKGGIHAGELKTYVQLCLAMSEQAKELCHVLPVPQQSENDKYAFRCWMLRLGFIGDEFKTARTILLRNMDGDAAWRHPSCASKNRPP